ncbi:Uncharacterised protein [Mycobacteroides abscessus subsp. abscessus]|nr:Uncharacterised protein [Mycobacteroides abscessus subsp. abscessus]
MGIAALILWILTAAGGLLMFAVWIAKGGARQPRMLLPVALLGAVMLLRWLPVRRERDAAAATDGPPERHFPVVIVLGHGVFAVATVILVLATALEVGN